MLKKLCLGGLVVLSLVVGLVLFELILRCFPPPPFIGPSLTCYDPTFGVRLKKHFIAQRSSPDFLCTISMNDQGFRQKDEVIQGKPSILYLGDSFTMGYGVNDGEEYPALVKASLKTDGLQTVNAGVGNVGCSWMLRFLTTEAEQLKPRILVLEFFQDYPGRDTRDGLYIQDAEGRLQATQVPEPSLLRRYQAWVEAIPVVADSYTFGVIRNFKMKLAQGRQTTHQDQADLKDDALTIDLAKVCLNWAKERNIPTVAIFVGHDSRSNDLIREMFEHSGVKTIVIPWSDARSDLYYATDMHWNAQGHQYVANQLAPVLREMLAGL